MGMCAVQKGKDRWREVEMGLECMKETNREELR